MKNIEKLPKPRKDCNHLMICPSHNVPLCDECGVCSATNQKHRPDCSQGEGMEAIRHLDLLDKQSIVRLLFLIESGWCSKQRAAEEISKQAKELR